MDTIQTQLKKASTQITASLNDRQRLKALLSDCLAGNKLQLNILLNAYDNGLIEKLQHNATVSDKSLFLQGLVQSLTGDYGISEKAALWAIETWCIILDVPSLSSDKTINTNIASSANIDVVLSQFESYISSSLKSSTVKSYMNDIRKFISYKDIGVVSDINSDNVNDYIENGIDGFSSITALKRRRGLLEKLLRFLVDSGLVQPSLLSDCEMDISGINQATPINTTIMQNTPQISTNAILSGHPLTQNNSIQTPTASQNNPLMTSIAIPGVPQVVLDRLLEDDDYIDFSLSLKDTYYIIRSPSNELKAGISFDKMELVHIESYEYHFTLTIPRKLAAKKYRLRIFLYSDKGSYMDCNTETPVFDHYSSNIYAFRFPKEKFTKPFFIRLLFDVK